MRIFISAIVIALSTLLSVSALAKTNHLGYEIIQASQHSCHEIEQAVVHYGAIELRFGSFFARAFYSTPDRCMGNERAVGVYFKAQNREQCFMRWACEADPGHNK